jgi:hypothetical protein
MCSALPSVPFQLLDACSVINLWASCEFERILKSPLGPFAVVDIVARESLFVRRGGSGPNANDREAIVLRPLIEAGLIQELVASSPAELTSFVQFASQIDDGEAMTCAIAVSRGHAVVTDDRKTLRLLARDYPQVPTLTTSSIIRAWADAESVPLSTVASMLKLIHVRARFLPGKHDPHQVWWQRLEASL